ncbi:restriction endonuclease subunit S [Amylibacter sp.]|nr:restriction endonuclease subunit S [Amylibacter sp.]
MNNLKLFDVIEVIGGGTPKRNVADYWNGDIDWLSVKDFNADGRYVHSADEKITILGLNKSSTKMLAVGDLIISARGTVGCLAQLTKPMAFNQSCYGIRGKENLDNDFLFYFLKTKITELQKNSHGAVFDTITTNTFKILSINLPPLDEQKAIASVLGALDDKIENNRRMNETLEEMARAIFKSWFVDFDPVHAKAAGNAPAHMDAETAALFPSSFGDDGLPVGFNSKNLIDGDTELESGKRPKGGIDKSLHEGIPSIGAESLQKIGDFDYSKVKFVGKEFAENSSKGWVQNYDVAIYKDGANVGDPTRVGLFGNGFPFDKFMVNEHVFLLRSKKLGQPFLYSLCQSEMLSHQLKSMGTSKAAQPGLNQQEVLSCEYIAPPQVLSSAFNKLVSPFIDRRLSLGLENQTLAELRDTLLPKLMSGEIRVKDAERAVEAAV